MHCCFDFCQMFCVKVHRSVNICSIFYGRDIVYGVLVLVRCSWTFFSVFLDPVSFNELSFLFFEHVELLFSNGLCQSVPIPVYPHVIPLYLLMLDLKVWNTTKIEAYLFFCFLVLLCLSALVLVLFWPSAVHLYFVYFGNCKGTQEMNLLPCVIR